MGRLGRTTRVAVRIVRPRLAPSSNTINVGQALETDTATATIRYKVAIGGRPAESDIANSISPLASAQAQPVFFDFTSPATTTAYARFAVRSKPLIIRAPRASGSPITVQVGQATETDTALAVTRVKVRAVGQASEVDVARAVGRVKTRPVGQATESDISRSIARIKVGAVGRPTESDTAASINNGSGHFVAVGQAIEIDVARTVSATPGTAREPVFPATETDIAYSVAPRRSRAVGMASEGSVARSVLHVLIRAIGRPTETDLALSILPRSPGVTPVGKALEVESARALSWWRLGSRGRITTTRRGPRATIATKKSRASIGDRE